MLIWSAEGPEGNWAATKLGEPALKLGLGGVVWETSHVEDLAALREESTDISASIHWAGEDIWVLVSWLRLVNQATKNAGKSNGLLHSTAWRRWSQRLEVEWKVVLNWGGGSDWLDLKSSADVGKHRWAEWERLRVVLLPSLVLSAEVEGAGVLEVWWEDNSFVAGLARKLNTEVPAVEGDEGELEVLRGQVLVGKRIEAGDSIAESARIADVLPSEGSQAGCFKESVFPLTQCFSQFPYSSISKPVV